MSLQLAARGHLMLCVMRTPNAFWVPPYPKPKLLTAIVTTQIAAVFRCTQLWLVPALPWGVVGLVWRYNPVWMLVQDIVKLGLPGFMETASLSRVLRMLGHERTPLDT
jgi:H+-transporting ATPase